MKQKYFLIFLSIFIGLFIFSSLPAIEARHLSQQGSPGLQTSDRAESRRDGRDRVGRLVPVVTPGGIPGMISMFTSRNTISASILKQLDNVTLLLEGVLRAKGIKTNTISTVNLTTGRFAFNEGPTFIATCSLDAFEDRLKGLYVLSSTGDCPTPQPLPPPPPPPPPPPGGGTVTIFTDPNDSIPARYLVMGTTDNKVFRVKLKTDSNPVTIGGIRFDDNNPAGPLTLYNLKLYDDNNLLAGPVNLVERDSENSTATFNFTLNLAPNSSNTLTLTADVKTRSQGAVSGSIHIFGVAANTDVKSDGTVTGVPTSGNQQAVYRTKPSLSSSVLGSVNNRVRAAVDDVAALTWGAHSAGDVRIQSVRFTFRGAAIASPTLPFAVSLIDAATNGNWGSSTQQTCTPSGIPRTCSVTFPPHYIISRGTTKTTKLRVDSRNFANVSQQMDVLSVTINAAGDILWGDGTTDGIFEEEILIPVSIGAFGYE